MEQTVDTFNDDDQAQQLKEWWKQNWQPILLGLGLSVGGVLGWNSWQSHKQSQAELASGHFEQLRLSLAAGNLEAAQAARQSLAEDYAGSPYAAQAALVLAQYHVEANDLDTAAAQLEWVVENTKDDKLAKLAGLRLARVFWAQGKDEEALTILAGEDQGAFASLYAELRGDILLAQGQTEKARAAYQQALALATGPEDAEAPGVGRSSLQDKLDDLATSSTDSTANDS